MAEPRLQSVANADRDLQMYMVRIAGTLGELLGDLLVGVYVHGTLASGQYVRDSSSMEVLAVVSDELPASQRESIDRTIARIAADRPMRSGVTITVVERSAVSGGEAACADLRNRGVTLYGPPPERLFGGSVV